MTSINQTVRSKLKNRAYMLEAIEQGYANLSEIARTMKSEMEEEREEVDIEAVKIAVRRFAEEAREESEERSEAVKEVLQGSKVRVRDNLALEFSDQKKEKEGLVAFSKTPSEGYMYLIEEELSPGEKDVEEKLAAVILVTPGIEEVPGATAYILRSIAEEDINIVALLGTGKDNIFVVKERDVPEMYKVLKDLCR